MLQMMIVPAFLVFSGTAWYPYYAHIDPAWRLTPMQDQSLAGLIMWMPSNVLFLVLGGYHVARWLQDDERRASEQVRYIDVARGPRPPQRNESRRKRPARGHPLTVRPLVSASATRTAAACAAPAR